MGDFADGYALRALMESGSGGGNEPENLKWQRPADWLLMSDPDDNGWNIQVVSDITHSSSIFYVTFIFIEPEKAANGYSVIIDWGDGTEQIYEKTSTAGGFSEYHTYASTPQFVIIKTKVIADGYDGVIEVTCYQGNDYMRPIEIFLGKNVKCFYSMVVPLVHVKYYGWIPQSTTEALPFANSNSLQCVETVVPWKIIPDNAFVNAPQVCDFDFSECEYIGSQAFSNTMIKKVIAPKCQEIGDSAFNDSDLLYISAENVHSVGYRCFYQSDLTFVFLKNLKNIGNGAFYDTKISNCDFFETIEELKNGAEFFNCFSLQEVSLPQCTIVSSNSFCNCRNLQKVSIPKCLQIGSYAFRYCYSLSELEYNHDASISSNSFSQCRIIPIKYSELAQYAKN